MSTEYFFVITVRQSNPAFCQHCSTETSIKASLQTFDVSRNASKMLTQAKHQLSLSHTFVYEPIERRQRWKTRKSNVIAIPHTIFVQSGSVIERRDSASGIGGSFHAVQQITPNAVRQAGESLQEDHTCRRITQGEFIARFFVAKALISELLPPANTHRSDSDRHKAILGS